MVFNEIGEAMKGFTDLPIAALSLLFGILLVKKNAKKDWSTLFFIVACAGVLGSVVHGVALSRVADAVVWTVLHPFLYEAVRRFGLVFSSFVDKKERKSPRTVFLVEIAFYLAGLPLLYLIPHNDIYSFATFAVLIFVQTVVAIARAPHLPKLAVWFLVFLAIPLLLQIGETVIPYAVVIEHLFLALDLYIAYRIAKKA